MAFTKGQGAVDPTSQANPKVGTAFKRGSFPKSPRHREVLQMAGCSVHVLQRKTPSTGRSVLSSRSVPAHRLYSDITPFGATNNLGAIPRSWLGDPPRRRSRHPPCIEISRSLLRPGGSFEPALLTAKTLRLSMEDALKDNACHRPLPASSKQSEYNLQHMRSK